MENLLQSLGIPSRDASQYAHKLLQHGFDTPAALDLATAEDLEECGVRRGHARVLLHAVRQRRCSLAPAELTCLSSIAGAELEVPGASSPRGRPRCLPPPHPCPPLGRTEHPLLPMEATPFGGRQPNGAPPSSLPRLQLPAHPEALVRGVAGEQGVDAVLAGGVQQRGVTQPQPQPLPLPLPAPQLSPTVQTPPGQAQARPRARAHAPPAQQEHEQFPSILHLNVGGKHFSTRLDTVRRHEGMLDSMFSGRFKVDRDGRGRYFIDRDGTYFRHILNFLRDGTVPSPSVAPVEELYREALFYRLDDLAAELSRRYFGTVARASLEEMTREVLGDEFEALKAKVRTLVMDHASEHTVLKATVRLTAPKCSQDHDLLHATAASPTAASPVLHLAHPLLAGGAERLQTVATLLQRDLMREGFQVQLCHPSERCMRFTCSELTCGKPVPCAGLVFRLWSASTERSAETTLSAVHDLLSDLVAGQDHTLILGGGAAPR